MSTVRPVRRQIVVGAPPERAFALFTERIGEWWPLGAGHSVFGEGGTVAFEGRELVERAGDRVAVWGEVLTWEPPGVLELTWHPGRTAEITTRVRVTFEPDDERTVVILEHDGWERLAEPEAARDDYDEGWPHVLARFAAMLEDRWFALLHRPGPALPEGASIFAQPEFAEHLAFLGRLRERGLLVAAGPVLGGEDGSGMTVVRVRPEHGDVDVEELATKDDPCVAQGFLSVDVRPWRVMLTS